MTRCYAFEALNERPIAFFPIYADITGTVNAALLLSQLMYWHTAMKGKEFYKTDDQIMQETRLGSKQLINAKAILEEKVLISIERKGVPAKSFYTIHLQNIKDAINRFKELERDDSSFHSSSTETAELVPPKRLDKSIPNGRTTTENNTYILDLDLSEPPKKISKPKQPTAKAFSKELQYMVESWNETAEMIGTHSVNLGTMSQEVKTLAVQFWQEHQKQGWEDLLNTIQFSPWLGHQNTGSFRACFGWAIKPVNVHDILTGKYMRRDAESSQHFPPDNPNSDNEMVFDESIGRMVCLKLDEETLKRFDPSGIEWKYVYGKYWKMALESPVVNVDRRMGPNPYNTLNSM